MTRNLLATLVIGFGLLIASKPVLAHHSESAEYDGTKPVKVTGTISKVEWMNPHIYTDIEAKDPTTGKTVVFQVEGGAPNSLYRSGWRADTLKIGEMVSVTGSRASDCCCQG